MSNYDLSSSPLWIKFDQAEIDKLNSRPPSSPFSIAERPDYIEIKRVVTFGEIKKYLELSESSPLVIQQIRFSDLKVAYIEADVLFLSSLGYGNIEMLELMPGDTAISYILRAKRI